MPSHGDWSPSWASRLEQRALALWPRLDRRAIRRCAGDAHCVVRVVSRRTALSADAILSLLLQPPVTQDEGTTWFG
jgi:hypothetical protein